MHIGSRTGARSEREVAASLGESLIAARPARAEALPLLCRMLAEHWFGARGVLPVVSACAGEGRTRIAAGLAQGFAAMGVCTLLIDADLRSPSLHRRFGLDNRRGLADLLAEREIAPAACGPNLAVLVAGCAGRDPLELLSRSRLREFLAAAARRFGAVLVDTPAAARGPDLQIVAANAGGALVIARRPAAAASLKVLRSSLETARARVVATLFSDA